MAKSSTFSATLVLLVGAAMVFVAASAPSPAVAPGASATPAPSPGVDCMTYLLNLADCLTYVQQGSNLTKPDKPCCPEVKTLLQEHPICLCELLAHPDQSPIPIDLPKAIGLPSVCKLKLPFGTNPATGCAALGVPIMGAPAPAPAHAHGPAHAHAHAPVAPTPSSGGTVPPTALASPPTSPSSDGHAIAASQWHFLVGLGILLFLSFF